MPLPLELMAMALARVITPKHVTATKTTVISIINKQVIWLNQTMTTGK
jgi:hypothetical protein